MFSVQHITSSDWFFSFPLSTQLSSPLILPLTSSVGPKEKDLIKSLTYSDVNYEIGSRNGRGEDRHENCSFHHSVFAFVRLMKGWCFFTSSVFLFLPFPTVMYPQTKFLFEILTKYCPNNKWERNAYSCSGIFWPVVLSIVLLLLLMDHHSILLLII